MPFLYALLLGTLLFSPISAKESGVQAENTFIFFDTKGHSRKITLHQNGAIFHTPTKPIVILNIFTPWCTPCRAALPTFRRLGKKYAKNLEVMGILTHHDFIQSEVEAFLVKSHIGYFVASYPTNDHFGELLAQNLHLDKAYPIPLTVIYLKGEYFTHYEGNIPMEMIEYDIQQAEKKLHLR